MIIIAHSALAAGGSRATRVHPRAAAIDGRHTAGTVVVHGCGARRVAGLHVQVGRST